MLEQEKSGGDQASRQSKTTRRESNGRTSEIVGGSRWHGHPDATIDNSEVDAPESNAHDSPAHEEFCPFAEIVETDCRPCRL
jgi:hypothetical protein